jgi:transcriptional regulator with XRE-family HTH domain
MVDHGPSTQPPIQQTLAANLRRLRIARQLSLSELARATGISKATLSSIESGNSNPTVDTLGGLAGALRVTVGELLEELPLPPIRIQRAAAAKRRPLDGTTVRGLERFVTTTAGETISLTEVELPTDHRREHNGRRAGARIGLFVIDGKLIAGPVERSTELAAGDYLAFPADGPFVLETGRRPARVLIAELTAG